MKNKQRKPNKFKNEFLWFVVESFSFMKGHNKLYIAMQIPYRFYLFKKVK